MRTFSFYKTLLSLSLLWFCTSGVSAQIMQKFGDNSNSINDKAVLEMESTTKGLLLPRMTKAQRDVISNPPEGLMLWCLDCSTASTSAIQIYTSNAWRGLLTTDLDLQLASSHVLLGNANGKATAVSVSGDIALNNTGVVTVVDNAITESKISASSVTYSKIQNVTPNRILGRTTTGIGSVEEIITTGTGSVVLSDSPILTGTPSLPTGTSGVTQTAKNNTTAVATTAYVDNANATNADLTGAITSTGNATLLGSFTSANLASALADETGTASVVLSDSPTLTGTTTTAVISATSIAASGTLGVTGATSLTTLETNGLATLNSALITNTLDVAGVTNLNNTTESTTPANGALIVLGGAGVAKNLNVGGAMGVTGATTLSTLSTSGLATLYSAAITTNASIGGSLLVTGVATLAAQPILQTLDPLLPVFTDDKRGLVSNPITGAENVVMSKSPILTGVPLAPTAELSTNTTQIATTAFVLSNSDQYYSVTESTPISTMASSDEAAMSLTSAPGGTYAVSFNAQYSIDATDRTGVAASDMLKAYNTLMAIELPTPTPTRSHSGTFLAAETFTPGVYSFPAAGTTPAGCEITLDGNGIYIFKFGAAFNPGATNKFILLNGAKAENVFWIAEAAVGLGADCNWKGTLISYSGAVSTGAGCKIEGKCLALIPSAASTIALSTTTVTNTASSSALNWQLMSSFAIFSKTGAISSTGTSIIDGDVGTENGSITKAAFQITGDFYTSEIKSANASFSVYQNGGLIANSTRLRSSNLNTVDVALQVIATVAAGQTIDIRYSIDSGTITLKNRVLTAIQVR